MNLLKYTNGIGHLIMSIVATAAGLAMILFSNDPYIRGTGVSIILGINASWFISGAAKQVATEVFNQLNNVLAPPAQVAAPPPAAPPAAVAPPVDETTVKMAKVSAP